MSAEPPEAISDALERLALSLGEHGAVPLPELVRALERAAERLRTRSVPAELPHDLVTQSEAARVVGVSRQAVNQWVRSGIVRSYQRNGGAGRYAPEVSLAEVAVAANRRSREVPFSASLRRELTAFLDLIGSGPARTLAAAIGESIDSSTAPRQAAEQSRVLREFVIAAMGVGQRRQEFTAEGVRLLAELPPELPVDPDSELGRLGSACGLLVRSVDGGAGFDSTATALLGLLGMATVGAQYPADRAIPGRSLAAAAEEVWGPEWPLRLYDVALHVSALRPSPLTRYTASLTYLDHNRFLRQAQASGVSIAYARGPGPLLPERFYGAHVLADLLAGRTRPDRPWAWAPGEGTRSWPQELPSTESPYRIFHYEYGLLDRSISGVRRYCFSAVDAAAGLRASYERLSRQQRPRYLDCAVSTLARTLALPFVELVSVPRQEDFDWWKDHIIRASHREILVGLRDERARRIAHGLSVQTSMLPEVVEAATDSALRDRLRIYVKNLEFDVVEARYTDDVRREVARVIKPAGVALGEDEARAAAEREVHELLELGRDGDTAAVTP